MAPRNPFKSWFNILKLPDRNSKWKTLCVSLTSSTIVRGCHKSFVQILSLTLTGYIILTKYSISLSLSPLICKMKITIMISVFCEGCYNVLFSTKVFIYGCWPNITISTFRLKGNWTLNHKATFLMGLNLYRLFC